MSFMGFTIAGQPNTLWAYPTRSSMHYVDDLAAVPAPASLALVGIGLLACGWQRRRGVVAARA